MHVQTQSRQPKEDHAREKTSNQPAHDASAADGFSLNQNIMRSPGLSLQRSLGLLLLSLGVLTLSSCGQKTETPGVQPKGMVVYATKDIEAGSTMYSGELEAKEMDASSIPKGALVSASIAEGRSARVAIKAGTLLKDSDLAPPSMRTQDPVSLALTKDGKTLATACNTSTITLWDLSSNKEPRSITARDFVSALAFSPDGKTLIGCRANNEGNLIEVIAWDVAGGKEKLTCKEDGYRFNNAVFAPDGKTSFVGPAGYDAGSGKAIERWQDEKGLTEGGALSPDGKMFVLESNSGDGHGGALRLYDVATRKPVRNLLEWHENEGCNPLSANAFSPDGKIVAAELYTTSKDKNATDDSTNVESSGVSLIDVASGKVLRKIGESGDTFLAFSHDGKVIACTGQDMENTIDLYDAASGKKLGTIDGKDLVFLPDGKQLVSGGVDGTVAIYDVASAKKVKSLK